MARKAKAGTGIQVTNADSMGSNPAAIIKSDGWDNLLTSANRKNTNRLTGVGFQSVIKFAKEDFEQLYRYSGLARKAVDLPAFEMTRQWITIPQDEDGDILERMEELSVKKRVRDALKWASLFGGALIVMILDDGGSLETPLNEEGLRSVADLVVYDRHQITWGQVELNQDVNSPNFGKPEFYTITPYTSGSVSQFRIHYSRVIRVEGNDLPGREKARNDGWSASVYESMYEELRNLGVINNSTAGIVQDFIQAVINIENLSEMIAGGQEDLVQKRLDIMNLGRSVMKTILLDKEETYSKEASSVAGLADLVDRAMIMLSTVTGIPVTKLFGRSSAGMNSTGDNDIRNFYDEIKSKQEDVLLPVISRIAYLIQRSLNGSFKGKELDDWSIEFNPLWQMSKKEEAEHRKTVAETDKIYIDSSVLDPSEVALARFGGQRYSTETMLDKKYRNKKGELPEPENSNDE